MNVLIFAAGLGTRLRPLTDTMPKALVPIQGRPLLRILLEKLRRSLPQSEPTTIVVNVHHFAEQIIDYLHANDNFGLDIRISDERDMLLDTGGGMRKAFRLFDTTEPVLVHNVDILSNIDIAGFYHRSTKALKAEDAGAVLEVSTRKSSRYLLADDDNRLRGWVNMKTGEVKSPYPSLDVSKLSKYAFSGIHVVSPGLLRPLMDTWEDKFPIIDFYLSVCDKIDIICERDDSLLLQDVGKPDTLNYLSDQNLSLLT